MDKYYKKLENLNVAEWYVFGRSIDAPVDEENSLEINIIEILPARFCNLGSNQKISDKQLEILFEMMTVHRGVTISIV